MEQIHAMARPSRSADGRLIGMLRIALLVCVSLMSPTAALARGGGHGGGGHGGHAGGAHAGGGHARVAHPASGRRYFGVDGLAANGRAPGSLLGSGGCLAPRRHHYGHHGGFGWDNFAYSPDWYYFPSDPCSPYFDAACNCYRQAIGCGDSFSTQPPPPPDTEEEPSDAQP